MGYAFSPKKSVLSRVNLHFMCLSCVLPWLLYTTTPVGTHVMGLLTIFPYKFYPEFCSSENKANSLNSDHVQKLVWQ